MSTSTLLPIEVDTFLDHLWLEHGLSQHTRDSYRNDLQQLQRWLEQTSLLSLSADKLHDYLAYRYQKGLSARSTARCLSCLRRFYQWALQEHLLQADPTLNIESPKLGKSLPKSISETDVERLLEAPDLNTPLGFRDRTMLELLYACGLRISELIAIELHHINLRQGVVKVLGKGSKERLVPMGEEAGDWLTRYCDTVRNDLLKDHRSHIVFPSQQGKAMTRQTFWHRIKQHAQTAGINTTISPHTLRHAFATHLLNHGADLRVVQMLLGHSNLSTTTIYTHIAQVRLQALHAQHHPRG